MQARWKWSSSQSTARLKRVWGSSALFPLSLAAPTLAAKFVPDDFEQRLALPQTTIDNHLYS
jgi:hypothetical protein